MTEKPTYVTARGLADLQNELALLREVKRPELVEQLQETQEDGDWLDRAEWLLVQNDLAFIDGRIRELEIMLDNIQLIQPGEDAARVELGDTVVIQSNGQAVGGELEKYTVVGVPEAKPEAGYISNECPLGRALLGHRVGELVTVTTPEGEAHYRIVAVGP